MSLTRHILSSSAQLTFANALARGVGIISLPLLTHWLTPAAYGQAALASTLITLISVVGLMGVDMSYARSYLSRTPPNGQQAEIFCWRFALGAAIVVGIAGALVWIMHVRYDPAAMPVVALLVFVGAAGSLLLAMARTRARIYNRHTRLAVAVALGGISATVITLAIARWWLPDERALIVGYVTAYVFPIFIVGIPELSRLRMPSGLSSAARKSVFLVGAPGVVTAPIYWILSSSDRWFLQSSTDSSTVGMYAVACTFGQLGLMVNSALLAIWLPEATRLHESGLVDSDRHLAKLITRLVVIMAVVCMGISIFGADMLQLFAAEKFHPAGRVIPLIAAGVFFYGCYHLARTGMFLRRTMSQAAWISAVGGVFSVAANAWLIPRYGMLAAASVQCVSFAVIAGLVMWMSQRKHPLPISAARLSIGIALLTLVLLVAWHLPSATSVAWMLAKCLLLGIFVLMFVRIVEPGLLGLSLYALARALRGCFSRGAA